MKKPREEYLHTSDDVNIPFTDPAEITFVVSNEKHTVSIFLGEEHKQTIGPGDMRKWSVTNFEGNIVFKDEEGQGKFGNGTGVFPIGGTTELALSLDHGPAGDCRYQLIGTDDIRNWGLGTSRFNLFNVANGDNYVEVCIINKGSVYSLWIKHASYHSGNAPGPCSGSVCTSVCFDEEEP